MRNQFKLVVLLVFVAVYLTTASTPPNEKQNEIVKEEVHEKPRNLIGGALNPRLNKMIQLPKDNQIEVNTKSEKSSKSPKSTEKKDSKDESSTIGEWTLE